MFSFVQKIAFVTGAGDGIGRAAARYLAADESAMVTGSNLMIGGRWIAGEVNQAQTCLTVSQISTGRRSPGSSPVRRRPGEGWWPARPGLIRV